MTYSEALKILDIEKADSRAVLKKKYRALMLKVHPDSLAGNSRVDYAYSAHEINAAYEFLRNHIREEEVRQEEEKAQGQNRWNAPVNENAYTEREVYQYIEGTDGSTAGIFSAAEGKYYLTDDEDYKLFLLSIYNCSKKLLERFPDPVIEKYHPEMAYLISWQFVDQAHVLEKYEVDSESGSLTYYVPAMLESKGNWFNANEGEILTPGSVRNHRLYLNDLSGCEAGYVSFADDRLYHALVPMFEQRIVRLKIRVSGSRVGKTNVKALDLWIKMIDDGINQVAVTVNSRIENLLDTCRKSAV